MKKSSVHSKLFKIACTNVPPDLLLKQPAKQYFSQFGKIIRLLLRPKSKTCVIEYDSEWSVQLALTNGGEYNGNHFTITRDTKHSPKKRQAKKEDDPDWTLDPEVQSELEAMGGFMIKKKYNLRPELMVVDAVDVPKAKESVKAVKSASKWRVGSPKTNQSSAAASSEKMELLKIIKQSAVTAEEKYKILEARDKLIRICTRKHTDLSKAAHTVGTCPDMCPEKERLMRETQHQVAVYEQEVGCKDMNPSLAVKQYSRSSADQEVPLPHELRPVHVLQMTMTYLMTRIMNLCDSPDVNFAEWYHFLWDRTRGIRKDITQQELCCQGSVQLVEQCARFHIHCSARLVAEDPSVFDQKINTENLTKCLQTLKYMYHDLELKRVRCENEAEFRAYIILLNLNDGNFMWEVQQLKPEIQKSDEVKFALQVYSALDKNNYVRFFNLVKSTTYLNACILLRYFIQVRLNALKTILKCFSPRSPHNSYPLDELTGILAFENADSTVDFLKYHGLQLNDEETHVVLERRLFGLPKFPYALDRAIGVIESKRVCSVGEVVCGKYSALVDFEGHVPQDSFTADGFLACNLDEFGGTKDLPTEIEVPEPKTEEPTKMFSFAAAGDSIFGGPATTFQSPGSIFGSSIFQNLPESEFSKSPDNSSDLWKRPELDSDSWPFKPSEAASEQTETVFGADTLDSASSSVFVPDESPVCAPRKSPISIFTIPSNEEAQLQEMRREEEARRENEIEAAKELQRQLEKAEKLRKKKAEKEERLKLEREQRQRDLEREKQRKLAEKKKKQEELRLQREKIRHEQQIKRDVSHIMNQLLTKVELTHRENRVKTLQQKLRLRKLKLVFTKWRETARIINRKRKAMDLTPVYFPSRTPKEEADELRTRSQDLTLQLVKRYKHGKPNPVAAFQEQPAPKIEVHELVHKTLLTSRHALGVGFCSELFWKVVVSVQAGIACERSMRSVDEILDECLRWTRSDGAKRLVI